MISHSFHRKHDYTPQKEEIEALLEEIAELRTENLEVRQEIAEVIANFNSNAAATEAIDSQTQAG